MRKLEQPGVAAVEVLQECAATVADVDLRDRLGLIADEVAAADLRYAHQGQLAELFRIPGTTDVIGIVSTSEMVWLYEAKLSRLDDYARPIYDAIKLAPVNGFCPLCGQRTVSTLDHYLSKTQHPVYGVTPLNLVPACSDCNKLKLNRQPGNASEQTLHPYFDDVDGEVWLKGTLTESNEPALTFYPDPPHDWDDVLRGRIEEHFRIFGLAELYAANAAAELSGLRHEVATVHDSAGALGVRDHLRVRAASRRAVEKNSWQTAMYEALAGSQWFWSGGYQHIVAPGA